MHCPQGKMAKNSGGAAFQNFATSGEIPSSNGYLIFSIADLRGKTIKFTGNASYTTQLDVTRFYGTEDDPHIQDGYVDNFSGWTARWSAPGTWGDDDTVMFRTSRSSHGASFGIPWTIT